MTPTITDDDKGGIFASVDGKAVRFWGYGQNDRDIMMIRAREYAEGWHDCSKLLNPTESSPACQ
jgi:hypothetical protein